MFSLVPEFLEFSFLMAVYLVAASFATVLALRVYRWFRVQSRQQEVERDVLIARVKARAHARSAARLA